MTKTVLITGASSGLGTEFAKIFAEAEYDLVITARSKELLNELADFFPDRRIKVIQKDLSQSGAAREIAEELHREGIKIDFLINNAGFGLRGFFSELPIEKQTEMIHLNIISLTELTRYLLPDMIARNSGRILNVASTAAFQPGPMMSVYFATKAYVLSFSEALAEELADTNITVTALCPGATKTNFGQAANAQEIKLFSHGMQADEVAKEGVKGFLAGKRVVITGNVNKASVLAAKVSPRSTAAKAVKAILTSKK